MGWEGLGARHVAGEAGLATSTVQRYFPAQSGLAAAVLDHVIDQLVATIDDSSPAEGRLDHHLRALAHAVSERPALFLVYGELELRSRRDALLRAGLARSERRWRSELAALLDQASWGDSSLVDLILATVKGVKFDGARAAAALHSLRRLVGAPLVHNRRETEQ
jgi:AcrR family transcriptional regulator